MQFVPPESTTIPLPDGGWIKVRRRLNAGEYRAHMKRSRHLNYDGSWYLDTLDHARSVVVAYLLDWSSAIPLRDEAGAPLDPEALGQVLDNLDPDDFIILKTAIVAHEVAVEAARAEKKTPTGGTTASAPTSPSPSGPAGPSSTSDPSASMTTRS